MAVLYGAYRTDIKAIDHVKLIPDRSPSIDFKQIDLLGARCPLFFNLNHRISAPGASGSLEVVYHTVDHEKILPARVCEYEKPHGAPHVPHHVHNLGREKTIPVFL